jgi:hypothetical protein
MPQINKIHVDQVLSQISIQYKNNEYIADQIFPKLAVKKSSDKYFVFSRDFKLQETRRAAGGKAREYDFDLSTASYVMAKNALKTYISDDEVDNYDLGTLKADATEILTDKLNARKEKDAVELLDATGTWSLQHSLAVAWSTNSTTSDPVPSVNTALATLVSYSGQKPNFMVLPFKAELALKNHVSVLDRVKYTSKEVTSEILKGLFGIEQIVVPTAVYDTTAPGVAESMSYLFDAFAFIGYKAPRPSPRSVSFGYMFEKNVPRIKTWRDEERESEAIEANMQYSMKVVCSLCGYLIKGTNA